MASTIKVNNIQNTCGANIISESANTITLGASGDNIVLGAGATQSGFGRTGTVDWDTTAKTTNFTAVSGNGYFVNTTSGAITVTMPASPSAGDIVGIKDYAGTFASNNVTIGRNGSNFDGSATNPILSTNQISVFFVYVDGTQGWKATQSDAGDYGPEYVAATGGTETTCGDYKIHTFTGPGTFCVSNAGNSSGSNRVEYIVVGGGGGAGFDIGGGAGAGGFRFASPSLAPLCYPAKPLAAPSGFEVSLTSYPITVGGGGTSASTVPVKATDGSSSVFSIFTATGGGAGGSSSGPNGPGNPGGSGGGTGNDTCGAKTAGSGNTPPTTPPQGNPGGSPGSTISGAGGGGAIAAGSNSLTPDAGGPGGAGAGVPTSAFGSNGELCGSFRYFSGGGGGGGRTPLYGPGGAGGVGGGGDGVQSGAGNGGTANTGGGAGGPSGSSIAQAGAGGSGIVIIRYKYQ